MDQLTKIQTELQETVKDLAKGKKKYFETEQMAHAVREKADIEAKYVFEHFWENDSAHKCYLCSYFVLCQYRAEGFS